MSREDNQMLGTAALVVADVSPDMRGRAVRAIAAHPAVTDAADLLDILDALDLHPAEARQPTMAP